MGDYSGILIMMKARLKPGSLASLIAPLLTPWAAHLRERVRNRPNYGRLLPYSSPGCTGKEKERKTRIFFFLLALQVRTFGPMTMPTNQVDSCHLFLVREEMFYKILGMFCENPIFFKPEEWGQRHPLIVIVMLLYFNQFGLVGLIFHV